MGDLKVGMDWAARLVGAARERQPERMDARERLVVTVTAAAFVLAVVALFALRPIERDIDPLLIAGLVVGYALLSSIEFEIGSIYAVPEAPLFVPLLFLVPLPFVPVIVALAFIVAQVPQYLRGELHPERWIYGLADAWFTIGPVAVIALFDLNDPHLADLPVFVLAFVAGFLTQAVLMLVLECAGRGGKVRDVLKLAAMGARIEASLWPIGIMAAVVASHDPWMLLGIAPLVWMLRVFSRERQQRYAAALELNRAYRGTVMLLADVVEAEDNYTADHCRSVVELVTAVADELGISPDERLELEFAALLHDVGKIAIPKEILNKPAALTPEEFEVMKTHTIEGQLLLDRVGGLLGRVGRIVRSCHERWDGKGYPDGLAGEEIPLAARIVFACDAFNAMTTTRPYREAMPVEEALDELRRNAGTQFDPWVVAALVRVVEHGLAEVRPTPAEAVRALFAEPPAPPQLRAAAEALPEAS
jgi:HD-GYP domain-containing protein (c-di-GMP phosphodiesterase class II)